MSSSFEAQAELLGRIDDLTAANGSLESVLAELRHVQQHVGLLNRDLMSRNANLQAVNGELEAFCYAVSHDLRAPLRSIHGFAEALADSAGSKFDESESRMLERICDAAGRMETLIEDLLKLSRVTRSDFRREPVNLTAVAREVGTRLIESDPERDVRFGIAPGLTAAGDPVLIRVILENLLGNAFKYTSQRPRAAIAFALEFRRGERAFCVRDNGAGFDMAYAKKLFTPFQRLHSVRDFPGSGVGLACVARAVHRHGGWIEAEASVDEGAAFYFTLAGPEI